MVEQESGKMKRSNIYIIICVSLVFSLCIVLAFLSAPEFNMDERLVIFENNTFRNTAITGIVEATSIKSGDVLLSVSIQEFLLVCENKTIYKTTSHLSFTGRLYHCFVEGNDGELKQYSTRAFYFSVEGWGWTS